VSEGRDMQRKVVRVLGEMTLIFLGITAALWFEDMNAARHERALETQILREMSESIALDTVDLHINLSLGDSIQRSIDTVLVHLRSSAPYDQGLAEHFGRASRYVRFFHNPAAYEHLRSAGLDVISNDSLRQAIISYYDQAVPLVAWLDQAVVANGNGSYVLPQMMAKFEYASPFEPAVPLDFRALKEDVAYGNALRMASSGIAVQTDVTQRAVASAESLLHMIEAELARR
jgi:hypothetical protein